MSKEAPGFRYKPFRVKQLIFFPRTTLQILGLVASLVHSIAFAQDEELVHRDDKVLPSFEELMTTDDPYSWLVNSDDTPCF